MAHVRAGTASETSGGVAHPTRGEWKERVDEHLEQEPDTWVQPTCVLCSTGCALDIGVKDGRIVGVRGRAVDRVNCGRLGLNGWMANNSPDRLTHPLIRRGMASSQPPGMKPCTARAA